MPKNFQIVEQRSNYIEFQIGPEVKNYSCTREEGITAGWISTCKSSDEQGVLVFGYDPFNWKGVITNQAIIKKMRILERPYWLDYLVKETLRIAAENSQLIYLIGRTCEIKEKKSYHKGRTDQTIKIVESLGLNSDKVDIKDMLWPNPKNTAPEAPNSASKYQTPIWRID